MHARMPNTPGIVVRIDILQLILYKQASLSRSTYTYPYPFTYETFASLV